MKNDINKQLHRLCGLTVLAALLASVMTPTAFGQAPTESVSAAAPISAEALEKLVDRIALYPDDLIALILPASTNPLQIVQADRFLVKRKSDPKAPLDDNWDDAVKSLLNYPEVVTSMSADLNWTAALGEAVVADQGEVLEAVQAFRRKTQSAGNLKSDDKQTVVVEKEVIKIEPADPQVIYVPQYNPSTVVVQGGYSSWGYYPSPYPVYYYPYAPGAALATGLIWGAAIGAIWSGGHYVSHYGGGGNNNINIDRSTNINTGNIGRGSGNNVNRPAQGGGSTQWKANKQPGQVSRSVGATAPARVGDARAGGGSNLSSASTRPSTGANTMSSRPTSGGGDRGGGAGAGVSDRGGGGGGGGGGSSAFDGYGSGRQTQMDSSRGAASRSSASPSRQGGGGAGRGGGGGGRRR